uniref:Uncharacterized protein n=1 Tax=Panagrellus redivivus TaxID=6233 RepID=A0A7E4W5K6_PANRE
MRINDSPIVAKQAANRTQKEAVTPTCRHSVSVLQKPQQNDENITVSEICHSNVTFASQKNSNRHAGITLR